MIEDFLEARRVALIGASSGERDQWSYNARITRALVASSFDDLVLVSRRERVIGGRPAVDHISAAPGKEGDVCVVVVPHGVLAKTVAECADAGWTRILVLTGQLSDEDREALREVVPSRARLWGPNCTGYVATESNHYVTAVQFNPLPRMRPGRRRLAVLGQSGGVLANIARMIIESGMSLSHFMSVGEEADLGVEDMMEYVAQSRPTDALVVFVEQARQPDRFLAALDRCSEAEVPVAIIKVGRTANSRLAAETHSGALVGDFEEFEAAAAQRGGMICRSFREAVGAATIAAHFPRRQLGRRTAFFTSSGGTGALVCDLAETHSLRLAQLAPSSVQRIRQLSDGRFEDVNPYDSTLGGGTPSTLPTFLDATGTDPGVDVTVFLYSGEVYGPLVISELQQWRAKGSALLAVWPGIYPEFRDQLLDGGVPTFDDPDDTLRWLDLAAGPRNLATADPVDGAEVSNAADDTPGGTSGGIHSLSYREGSAMIRKSGLDAPRQWYLEAGADPRDLVASINHFPVVMKAADLLGHKALAGGVVRGVGSASQALAGMDHLAHLGTVVIEEEAPSGVEVMIAVRDGGLGGLIVIGLGGPYADGFGQQILVSASAESELIERELMASPVASVFSAILGPDAMSAAAGRVVASARELAELVRTEELSLIEVNPLMVSQRRAVVCDVKVQRRTRTDESRSATEERSFSEP